MRRESFLKAAKYGLFYPSAALFPLPVAYRLARRWGRLEARRNPGVVEAVRRNAELVLGSSTPFASDIGEKFFEVLSCDEIDAYAPIIHPWRRLKKWIRVSGEDKLFPLRTSTQGVLLLTFHVGGGSLVFPYLRNRGVPAHYLSISLPQVRQLSGRVQHTFGRFRLWGIQRTMGRDIIFVGGSKGKLRQVLRQGGTVVALLDVVPDALHIKEQAEVNFFGHRARFPTGLLAVAAETEAAIAPFFGRVGEDLHRHLSFEAPHRVEGIEETLNSFVGLLEAYIRRYPPEWHFWPGLHSFYA